MRTEPRSAPQIPDHEVLRKIGSGAYGEVWLARSVTRAWRAVKVVSRDDFDDERTFEREFEGVLRYEPISRDHPSLVHVLHVGRTSGEEPSYYYVMELGDDVRRGQDINAVEYEPRTLREELLSNGQRKPSGVDEVLDIGISLAEGLEHLHQNGLAHRDVKPANVIFVGGRAKLADLGLVAARDQRTFVGTEGFVPPEGPGSAASDIYALGKVLYELATGMDRLQFPELPDELPEGEDPKRWRRMNAIICETCEPRKEQRQIQTGAQLAEQLRALKEGRKPRLRSGDNLFSSRWLWLFLFLSLASLASWQWWEVQQPTAGRTGDDALGNTDAPGASDEVGLARVTIVCEPTYARISLANGDPIISESGKLIDEPGVPFMLRVGTEIQIRFVLEGYRTELSEPLTVSSEGLDIYKILVPFSPPTTDLRWTDSSGMEYTPQEGFHLSDKSISQEAFNRFEAAVETTYAVPSVPMRKNGQDYQAVLLTRSELSAYLGWLKQQGIEEGNLSRDFSIEAEVDNRIPQTEIPELARSEGRLPYRLRVKEILWASVKLSSEPPGAAVFQDGRFLGLTGPDLVLNEVEPGLVAFKLSLEGYHDALIELDLPPRGSEERAVQLMPNDSAVFGKSWSNSLGMKFVPLGNELLVSVHEVRVQDYEQFSLAVPARRVASPPFEQDGNEPVVLVSYEDARAFCQWLTQKEREAGSIKGIQHYRLPTDIEWSLMNGFEENERQDTPRKRHAARGIYPWGDQWPPNLLPEPPGNFADRAAAGTAGVPAKLTIPGYMDQFPRTAPVGSFPANSVGIYDLAGNVAEWVMDTYGKQGSFRDRHFTRGGSFLNYRASRFDLGHREIRQSGQRFADTGFRIVLARKSDAFSFPEAPGADETASELENGE